MEPTTDLQFIAQMLVKSNAGDQITRPELDRLDDIAENGHTTGQERPRTPALTIPPEHAGATRVGVDG